MSIPATASKLRRRRLLPARLFPRLTSLFHLDLQVPHGLGPSKHAESEAGPAASGVSRTVFPHPPVSSTGSADAREESCLLLYLHVQCVTAYRREPLPVKPGHEWRSSMGQIWPEPMRGGTAPQVGRKSRTWFVLLLVPHCSPGGGAPRGKGRCGRRLSRAGYQATAAPPKLGSAALGRLFGTTRARPQAPQVPAGTSWETGLASWHSAGCQQRSKFRLHPEPTYSRAFGRPAPQRSLGGSGQASCLSTSRRPWNL